MYHISAVRNTLGADDRVAEESCALTIVCPMSLAAHDEGLKLQVPVSDVY